jgi:hypothetical protein
MQKPNYYKQILQILERIRKAHPSHNMGKHLSTALDGSDVWGISDRALFFSLQKYEIELNIDAHHEDEIEDIIKNSMNLSSEDLLEEE